MIEDGASLHWVPVYVPAALAPEVLRSVASFLEAGGATAAGPSAWADAAADDIAVFFREVSPLEWRLISELARREVPTAVAELAKALGVEMGAVAGAIGPVNKRAKREGWTPPIQPRRFTPSGTSTSRRGLVLAAGLRTWINAHADDPRSDLGSRSAGGAE
ncbi:MAG TPA: hypothetical protein VE442_21845 [Jatrophihabitans sp.]|nr:hypothetical protein [Jatrophihabitans sp.]